MSDLIDTTEMYLRTILELEEEGTTPMRARIAERLHQSGPTVSQTVARMERDGLLQLGSERQLELTPTGRSIAIRVMRKHRLAECMLVDILGMPWEEVHAEACRWEHVMSESVERRLLTMLGNPSVSPFGNPIPGLDELDPRRDELTEGLGSMVPLSEAARADVIRVVVRRISEPLQEDAEAMARMHRIGVTPGASVKVHRTDGGITVGSGGEYAELPDEVAMHILVDTIA
ncbi:MAG: metal-dependent transcriptional regulator [Candidatus Nanopelagicales bacterium]|nr:metal-dependent transcriptional regulator [Candidatus Nanopelagicales bacterium]MCF8537324.1 metal-dependent transcriptional regulator [Candidatus Nanopelagicales bacterium]MCF8543116.1 metal-dependent transcriptional regulator [Candidatus Nanopelagicales bacterium]MCF8557199.1 metal-dependent transcriptional regulator [Candidatus Nanopelagicales bacterium]